MKLVVLMVLMRCASRLLVMMCNAVMMSILLRSAGSSRRSIVRLVLCTGRGPGLAILLRVGWASLLYHRRFLVAGLMLVGTATLSWVRRFGICAGI